jgi:hypothetical protein
MCKVGFIGTSFKRKNIKFVRESEIYVHAKVESLQGVIDKSFKRQE